MTVLNYRRSLSFLRTCLTKCLHTEKPVIETQKPLKQLIVQKIKATGPLTIAQFMKEVLVNPAFGYYSTRDVFGRSGDFITSPEICQMFGELVAVWFANEWMKVGAPRPFHLVEFGPGRGSMMSDVLRTFHQLKMDSHLQIHMIEVSDTLAKIQAEKLCKSFEDHEPGSICYRSGKTNEDVPIYWYKSFLDTRIRGFTLYLAHEFFDALPIHKFQSAPLQSSYVKCTDPRTLRSEVLKVNVDVVIKGLKIGKTRETLGYNQYEIGTTWERQKP